MVDNSPHLWPNFRSYHLLAWSPSPCYRCCCSLPLICSQNKWDLVTLVTCLKLLWFASVLSINLSYSCANQDFPHVLLHAPPQPHLLLPASSLGTRCSTDMANSLRPLYFPHVFCSSVLNFSSHRTLSGTNGNCQNRCPVEPMALSSAQSCLVNSKQYKWHTYVCSPIQL